MKIELLKPYGINPKGVVLDMAPSVATLLIDRKVAEEVKTKTVKPNPKKQ